MSGVGNICPECGNALQPWAHGACYICLRNEDDRKRYGRRRPRRAHPNDEPTPLPPRNPRKKQQPAPPKQPTKSQSPIVRSRPPIRYDDAHVTKFNVREARRGINKLLRDVYQKPTLLSHILRQGNLSKREIKALRQHRMSRFIKMLCKQWRMWLRQELDVRQFDTCLRTYGLRGEKAWPPGRLSQAYAVEIRDVHTQQQSVLAFLRQPAHRNHLEEIVLRCAKEALK